MTQAGAAASLVLFSVLTLFSLSPRRTTPADFCLGIAVCVKQVPFTISCHSANGKNKCLRLFCVCVFSDPSRGMPCHVPHRDTATLFFFCVVHNRCLLLLCTTLERILLGVLSLKHRESQVGGCNDSSKSSFTIITYYLFQAVVGVLYFLTYTDTQ